MKATRIIRVMDEIQRLGMTIPLSERASLKIRGCGNVTREWLMQHGVVKRTLPAFNGELGTRAVNCLANALIETKEEAKAAILDGRLRPETVRNYGTSTHEEVCAWIFNNPLTSA